MGRERLKRKNKLGFRFVPFPLSVLTSPQYAALSAGGCKLLLDLAGQTATGREMNGRLSCSMRALAPCGWRSDHAVLRARDELLDRQFIMETRKGRRPNYASWFAITFFDFFWRPEMDCDRNAFEANAWARVAHQSRKLFSRTSPTAETAVHEGSIAAETAVLTCPSTAERAAVGAFSRTSPTAETAVCTRYSHLYGSVRPARVHGKRLPVAVQPGRQFNLNGHSFEVIAVGEFAVRGLWRGAEISVPRASLKLDP